MKTFISAFFAILVSLSAVAATVEEGSTLTFEAVQNGAAVRGDFLKFDVKPTFADDIEQMQFETIVDVASVNATYDDIVTNLKTSDWLDVVAFPKAKYKSTAIKKIVDNKYSLLGELSLKGMKQEVAGEFTLVDNSADRFVADFVFNLNRLDYKIGWDDTGSVKNEVKITSHLIIKK